MRRHILRFPSNAQGTATIEYSLIAAGLALGVLMAVLSYSEQLQDIFAAIQAGVASLSTL